MEDPSQDDERFDASQYAFFGGAISQEVELGGLDEEDEIALGGDAFDEERSFLPSNEKEEDDALDAISQLDGSLEVSEMSSSFMNLGRYPCDLDVGRGISREVPNLSQRQWEGQEAGLTRAPFPVDRPPPSIPLLAANLYNGRQQVPASHGNLIPGYRPHVPPPFRRPLHPFSQHGGSHALYPPPPPLWHAMLPSHIQQGMRVVSPRFLQPHFAQQYMSLPLLQEAVFQRQFGHPRIPFANVHQPLFNPTLSVHSDDFHDDADRRDFRHDLEQQHRQTALAHHLQSSHRSANRDSTHEHFRSKYMTLEEIKGIARIQRAAAQNNDPYIGDYYHQAVQAKNGTRAAKGRHHFAPHQLRDLFSHRRSSVVQPSFVPVEGLGKVPFSSVRGPRHLLEVEDFSAQSGGANSLKLSERPLEQEPMLAARIAIEDGSCRLLDVDDIDRYLSASHLLDGGAQLRWQRQTLLEDLAASLQLLEHGNAEGNELACSLENNGHQMESEPKDVLLHIVSLPKGRKLVCRFLELLPEGNELVPRVCVSIFRHLHCLFGAPQRDPDAAASASKLAKMVASCSAQMDLNATSVCVGAVVSSSKQTSFSLAGEGMSLILKSSLDRATYLLTNSTYVCVLEDRRFWQTTFDCFFRVLLNYCTNTFDGIVSALSMSTLAEGPVSIGESAAEKMSKELPIELLRASLPHMNEDQKKTLSDFTQRSIAIEASKGHHSVEGDHIAHGNQANEVSD